MNEQPILIFISDIPNISTLIFIILRKSSLFFVLALINGLGRWPACSLRVVFCSLHPYHGNACTSHNLLVRKKNKPCAQILWNGSWLPGSEAKASGILLTLPILGTIYCHYLPYATYPTTYASRIQAIDTSLQI